MLLPDLQPVWPRTIHLQQRISIRPSNLAYHTEKHCEALDALCVLSGPRLHVARDVLDADVGEEAGAVVVGDDEVGDLFEPELRVHVGHVDIFLVAA